MNIANEASKLVTNKYFLYFIVFISVSNILGYIVTNKVNAVIFFALVAFLMTNFSKNMTVVLLVALIATNLLMANKSMREGMDNATTIKDKVNGATVDGASENADTSTDTLDSVDHQLGAGLQALKDSGNVALAKEKINEQKSTSENVDTRPIRDSNNANSKETEAFRAGGSGSIKGVQQGGKKQSGFHNAKGGSSFKNAAPVNGSSRIDYATTLEDAYDNLDKILGSDGINKLTGDTQKLMVQQQKLFSTMESMTPMIQQAKDMLDTVDMSQLGGLAEMANSLGMDTDKKK